MDRPIYYGNCGLMQANGRYIMFTKTGAEVCKGKTDHYIDEREAKKLIIEALEKGRLNESTSN